VISRAVSGSGTDQRRKKNSPSKEEAGLFQRMPWSKKKTPVRLGLGTGGRAREGDSSRIACEAKSRGSRVRALGERPRDSGSRGRNARVGRVRALKIKPKEAFFRHCAKAFTGRWFGPGGFSGLIVDRRHTTSRDVRGTMAKNHHVLGLRTRSRKRTGV